LPENERRPAADGLEAIGTVLEEEAEGDADDLAEEGSDAGDLAGEDAELFPLFVLLSDGFIRTVAV